jgi:hypothetical protein
MKTLTKQIKENMTNFPEKISSAQKHIENGRKIAQIIKFIPVPKILK